MMAEALIPMLANTNKLIRPGASTIKDYGFVIYGKWTDFLIS
jgi:hypothetical protein